MTFEKQVKEAKEKQLKSKITRDVIFLLLGIIFLVISILSTMEENKKEIKNRKTTINTSINK